jgi:hypothetical protein
VKNVVDSFLALGMSEIDAWRCVHMMQGRSCVVLLRMTRAGAPPDAAGEAALSYEDVVIAVERGAAWSSLGPGRWQYVRRVDWSLAQLKELQEELARFAEAPSPDDPPCP